MLALAALRDVPDELANRMMVAHGSRALLRALRGEPEPVEPCVAPRPQLRAHRPPSRRYVPVSTRPPVAMPHVVRGIIDAVADAFAVSVEDLTGKNRAKYLIHARAVAYRLIRDRAYEDGAPKNSLPQIAAYMNRDHSTIAWALSNFEIYCRHYPEVQAAYDALRQNGAGE